MAGLGSVPGSGAWLGACLGSVAVRPAVPARRLPFLLVVLCKGCPCCPVGVPVSVAAFGRGVFRWWGSARLGVWLWARLRLRLGLVFGSMCGCRCVAAFGCCRFGCPSVVAAVSRSAAVGQWLWLLVSCLGKGCPSPLFSRFFSSSSLLPLLNSLLFYYYYIS